jgi:hypothetical protein
MTASRTRWVISLLAIAGTLPYITLKLLWLSGSRVGLTDPSFGDDTVMQVANALTMAMDVVAIAMALSFVTAWGRRVPARLALFPMWVGTGFLAPILLIVPLQLLVGTPEPSETAELPPIADWVFALVYGGFMWQGAFLLTGFVLYARERWGSELDWRARGFPRTSYGGPVVAAVGLAVLGGLALVSHLVGAFRPQAVNVVGDAAMTALAVVGLVVLAGWVGRGLPRWVGIAAWWLGSGALAAWGSYLLVVLLVPNDLTSGLDSTWTDPAAELVRVAAGVTAAVVGARLVAAQAPVRPSVASASPRA